MAVVVLGRDERYPRFIADENRGSVVEELPLDVRVVKMAVDAICFVGRRSLKWNC